MALVAQLSRAGIAPTRIHTSAKVKLEKVGEAFAITRIDLETQVAPAGCHAAGRDPMKNATLSMPMEIPRER